jgi:hypothetical protein
LDRQRVNPDLVLSSFHFCGLHCTFGENTVVASARCVTQMEGISAADVREDTVQETSVTSVISNGKSYKYTDV